MDNIEAVNAMTKQDPVRGVTNHEVGIPVSGVIIQVKIVGPDEVAAMVRKDSGEVEECWPEDLEFVDKEAHECDDCKYNGKCEYCSEWPGGKCPVKEVRQ